MSGVSWGTCGNGKYKLLKGGSMDILEALRGEAEKLEQQLNSIKGAIKALGGGSPNSGNGRKHRNGRRKRHFSAAARKRMSLVAQARWSKIKAAK